MPRHNNAVSTWWRRCTAESIREYIGTKNQNHINVRGGRKCLQYAWQSGALCCQVPTRWNRKHVKRVVCQLNASVPQRRIDDSWRRTSYDKDGQQSSKAATAADLRHRNKQVYSALKMNDTRLLTIQFFWNEVLFYTFQQSNLEGSGSKYVSQVGIAGFPSGTIKFRSRDPEVNLNKFSRFQAINKNE